MATLSNVPATDLFTGYHRNPLPLTSEDLLAWNAEASCSSGESIDQASTPTQLYKTKARLLTFSLSRSRNRCAHPSTGRVGKTSSTRCNGVSRYPIAARNGSSSTDALTPETYCNTLVPQPSPHILVEQPPTEIQVDDQADPTPKQQKRKAQNRAATRPIQKDPKAAHRTLANLSPARNNSQRAFRARKENTVRQLRAQVAALTSRLHAAQAESEDLHARLRGLVPRASEQQSQRLVLKVQGENSAAGVEGEICKVCGRRGQGEVVLDVMLVAREAGSGAGGSVVDAAQSGFGSGPQGGAGWRSDSFPSEAPRGSNGSLSSTSSMGC